MASRFRSSAAIARDLSAWADGRGETQVMIAQRIGVRQPQVSRIMAGNFVPSRSRAAKRLCEAAHVGMFEVSRRSLDRGTRVAQPDTRPVSQAMRAHLALGPDDAGRIADVLHQLVVALRESGTSKRS